MTVSQTIRGAAVQRCCFWFLPFIEGDVRFSLVGKRSHSSVLFPTPTKEVSTLNGVAGYVKASLSHDRKTLVCVIVQLPKSGVLRDTPNTTRFMQGWASYLVSLVEFQEVFFFKQQEHRRCQDSWKSCEVHLELPEASQCPVALPFACCFWGYNTQQQALM